MAPRPRRVQTKRAAKRQPSAVTEARSEDERRLYERLDALGIAHRTVEHAATHTVAQSATVKAHLAGGHAKTLLVADKHAPRLIVAEASVRVDLAGVGRRLGCYGRLSFASEGVLTATLGLRPGAVTPFGLMHEGAARIGNVVIDEGLTGYDAIWLHPLRNTASTQIAPDDLLRFCTACGHEAVVMQIAKANDGTS